MKAEEHPLSQKPLIERITPGPWVQIATHLTEGGKKLRDDEGYRTINSSDYPLSGFSICGFISPEDAEAISRVPQLLKAEQERDTLAGKFETSQMNLNLANSDIAHKDSKIQELEETISALELSNAVMLATVQEGNKIYAKQAAKLEAILKGLEEIRVKTSNLEIYELCKNLLAEHGK